MFTKDNTRGFSILDLAILNTAAKYLVQDGIPREDVHYILGGIWQEGETLPSLLATARTIYKGYNMTNESNKGHRIETKKEGNVKFYELPEHEQLAIIQYVAKGTLENIEVWRDEWLPVPSAMSEINVNRIYRLKPKTLNIPWGVIDKKYNYAVLDKWGRVWLGEQSFEKTCAFDGAQWQYPEKEGGYKKDDCIQLKGIVIDTTGINYETSQVERP